MVARSDLQPPTDHYTFIPGEPGQEAPMSKTSLIPPSHPAASGSRLHRRGFLVGAGATGMALGTGLGSAYTQIATTRTIRSASRRYGSSSPPGR